MTTPRDTAASSRVFLYRYQGRIAPMQAQLVQTGSAEKLGLAVVQAANGSLIHTGDGGPMVIIQGPRAALDATATRSLAVEVVTQTYGTMMSVRKEDGPYPVDQAGNEIVIPPNADFSKLPPPASFRKGFVFSASGAPPL